MSREQTECDPARSETAQSSTEPRLARLVSTALSLDSAAVTCLSAVDEGVESFPLSPAPETLLLAKDALAAETGDRLLTQPIFLLPPWGDRQTRPRLHEQLVLDVPSAPTSHELAVFLPIASISSEASRSFRERLFSKWHLNLVAEIDGSL